MDIFKQQSYEFECAGNWLARNLFIVLTGIIGLSGFGAHALAQESGITPTTIRIGGVMDLEGDIKGLGRGMKIGIEAAFKNEQIQGRGLEFIARNDFYNPPTTIEEINALIESGVFAMLGNLGTPTARVSLPILAQNKIPAVGFYTGAGLLRPGVGDILNYRASYVEETTAIIKAAIDAGVAPTEICAYVQNDAYGMDGVTGIKQALSPLPGMEQTIALLDQIMALDGSDPPRNNIGPVGVYQRNTTIAKAGYESLKNWEDFSGNKCRLVVTVGTSVPVAKFVSYSHFKGDDWLISAISPTNADNLTAELAKYGLKAGVVMTQVVPSPTSSLPIVQEARAALGNKLNYVSLEGFIAAKMFLHLLRDIPGEITRRNFMATARGSVFDLGGLPIDFSDDNQGSDYVSMTYFKEGKFVPVNLSFMQQLF